VDGVGERLRAFRTARRLSQRDLGDRVGVTASFLSQLENGRTNASIATLRRLAETLGVRLSDLVEAGPLPTGRLLRRADRPQLSAAFGTTKWFITQPPLRHVEVYVAEIEPGGSTGPDQYQHGDSEEILLVLRGNVVLDLADQTYDLATGDSIEYRSSTPHRVANHNAEVAELIWLNSPPTPD
jgi:transcriptional regulator with XRE-family HTH domain